MSTMYRLILAAFTLVSLLTRFTKATIVNFELFGRDGFNPTVNLLESRVVPEPRPVGEVPYLTQFSRPSGQVLIALDNDGVLVPASQAGDSEKKTAQDILTSLAGLEDNKVWVVSARNLDGLVGYQGIKRLNLAGQHGTQLLQAGGKPQQTVVAGTPQVKAAVLEIANNNPMANVGLFDSTSSVPFKIGKPPCDRSAVEAVLGTIELKLPQFPGYKLRRELKNYFAEVKHESVDKGNFVAALLKGNPSLKGGIAIGDQESDEGMFKAMNQMGSGFCSVIVSKDENQKTHAQYRLNDYTEVHKLLRGLSG